MTPAQYHETLTFVEVPEHTDTRKLLDIWKSGLPAGWVVGRDIPSRMLAPLLSHLAVWEPLDEASDFRVRLAGDALHCRFEGDLKGRLMSELLAPESLSEHVALNRRVLASGCPEFFRSVITGHKLEWLSAEVIILPVLAPDCAARWLLSGAFFH